MTENKKINTTSITEQCYNYMIENNIKRLNVYDFIDYIKPILNLTEEEFVSQMSYFYTDLNLDGRFVCVEDGSWVLKDTLSVADVQNFVEPSITKFEIEDLDVFSEKDEKENDEEDNEDVTDELDALAKEEDEDEEDGEDLLGFEDEEIVSKFVGNHEYEEY